MARSLTMTAAPSAGTFPDFLRARFGAKWVLAPRMTDRLRAAGHERNVTRKDYETAEREWETLAYGAPVKSLEATAPEMLAALRTVLFFIPEGTLTYSDGTQDIDVDVRAVVRAAIAKAEGRA